MRIGFGSDIHKLVENRKLVLGGIVIPAPYGELAHSDGDVLIHALCDAILGALALGDIGLHFPDNSDVFKDIKSTVLLEKVVAMMEEKSYEIGNVDINISLESPKLRPFIDEMRRNIASIIKTDIKNVSIKAGTNEGLDAVGRKEAIKADAIVLLNERN